MRYQKERKNTNYIIVDCSTLAYAAYYSFGHLSYNDEPTGIIFGFLHKMFQISEKFKTNKFIFCFDSISTLHREIDYKGYKEKRRTKQMSEQEIIGHIEVRNQRDELRENILPKLGFKNLFLVPGFEADDLIAVFSKKISNMGFTSIIVTTDADMYQCLSYSDIYNPKTKEIFTEKDLILKYEITADKWAYAKAIGGCEGDGVIGINGVADPKKNTSKALKYINGLLNKGKIFNRIECNEGKKIIEKNLPIVTIPYREEDLPKMILRRDKLSVKNFISVFEHYGLLSFLKKDKFEKWKEVVINENGKNR